DGDVPGRPHQRLRPPQPLLPRHLHPPPYQPAPADPVVRRQGLVRVGALMVGPLNVRALMSEVIGDLHPVPAYPPWPSRGVGGVGLSCWLVARSVLNEQPARRGRLPRSLRSRAMTAFCCRRKGGSLRLRRLTLLLLLLTTLTACDDTVNPFTGADRYSSVYGW